MKIQVSWGRFIPQGSIVLACTTLGSYLLGLVRDRTFAQTFGASAQLDAYNAAFLVPDFAFNFLVASGIAAAVVPIFTQLRHQNLHTAYRYLTGIVTMAVSVMALSGIIVALGAPWLGRLIAPGLGEAEQLVVVQLMRILAVSPLLFAASNALGAMLVAEQRFFWYGLSPILYNVGIITGTLWLTPHFGIMGVAWGTVAGATLHLLARVIDAVRLGWSPTSLWQWPIPEFRATLKLMAPKMVGHPVELLTFAVFTSLASHLSTGSIAVLNFARNFQSVPVSIIGITMATAVFPTLTRAALTSPSKLTRQLRQTALSIGLASTAAALIMFIIRRPLISLLLGGGAFTPAAVEQTAQTLGIFCLAVPTESLSHLFARAFYATKNTTIPVLWSVVSLLVSAGSAYILSIHLGIVGLPLGFFLGSLAKTIGLAAMFRYRLARAAHAG